MRAPTNWPQGVPASPGSRSAQRLAYGLTVALGTSIVMHERRCAMLLSGWRLRPGWRGVWG